MRHLIALLLVLCTAPAHAVGAWSEPHRFNTFDRDFDADTRPWQEIEAQLPPYPKADNLVAFSVGPATRNRFFIDLAAIHVGADGVVRYSVVVRSPGGAENVSFEGMRCATRERKLYAFGRADGQGGGGWSRHRHARWEPIPVRQASSHQRELFFHYLCALGSPAELDQIRHALRIGGVRRGE